MNSLKRNKMTIFFKELMKKIYNLHMEMVQQESAMIIIQFMKEFVEKAKCMGMEG